MLLRRHPPFQPVAIVGLGLIGGSIALASAIGGLPSA